MVPPDSAAINVAGVEEDSITNGPGLRFVLFAQGCPHGCIGCHNPETQPFTGGVRRTVEELLRRIRRNPLQTGVTFTGGEPFCQAAAFARLAEQLRNAGKHDLAAYSGFTFEELIRHEDPAVLEFLRQLDVLVDGRFILARRDILLRFRGSDNQRVLDVPASLAAGVPVRLADGEW